METTELQISEMLAVRELPELDLDSLISVEILPPGDKSIAKATALAEKPIGTDGECVHVNNIKQLTARFRNALETARKKIKAPFFAAGKRVDEKYKPLIARVDKPLAALKARVDEFEAEKTRKYEEAMAKKRAEEAQLEAERQAKEKQRLAIQAAHAARGHETHPLAPVPKAVPIPTPIHPSLTSTTRYQVRFTAVITDITKVPAEYFQDDRVKNAVRIVVQEAVDEDVKAAREAKKKPSVYGIRKIPGVRVEQKKHQLSA